MSAERIKQLYSLYAANLEAFQPEFKGVMACPLCRQFFGDNDLDKLSIEHVIPQSVGGRIEVLTCKKCNNTFGTKVDTHLGRQLQAQDFLSGDHAGKLRQRVTGTQGRATVEVAVSKSDTQGMAVEIHLLRERSNPAQLEQLLSSLKQGDTLLGFDFLGNDKPDIRKARLSLLKSAYLLMVHYFGYGYMLTVPAALVHQQLAEPDQDLIPLKAAVRPLPCDHGLRGVCVVTAPSHLACFLLPVAVTSDNRPYAFGVVLPGYADPIQMYQRWADFVAQGEEANLSLRCFEPDQSVVTHPSVKNLPGNLWALALSGQLQ